MSLEIMTFIVVVIGTLFAAIPALQGIGLNVRIFGRSPSPVTDVPSKARWWLVLTVAFLGLSAGIIGIAISLTNQDYFAGMRIKPNSEELFTPADPNWHFGLRIQIQTEMDRKTPTELFVICDSGIGDGHAKFLKTGEFSSQPASHQVIANHPDVIIFKWGDAWRTDNPVVVELFSKNPIHAKYVVPMIYRGNAPYI